MDLPILTDQRFYKTIFLLELFIFDFEKVAFLAIGDSHFFGTIDLKHLPRCIEENSQNDNAFTADPIEGYLLVVGWTMNSHSVVKPSLLCFGTI